MIKRGAIILLLAGAALVGGCSSKPDVEVRAVGVSARGAASGDAVALGHAALAIGNAGLALQHFRQALRVDAGSVAALSGIALCYDHMGRVDLSRRYYQEALALAPGDTRVLRDYATALARHGAVAEAQAVISEIALRTRAPAAQWVIEPAPAKPTAPVAPAVELAQSKPAAAAPVTPKARLERLSLGEIALVTSGTPLWVALPAATPARSIRLLNAARREGLAARHRKQLEGTGWRSVAIGDAPRTRRSSLVLYPTGQGREARRLAADLRIAAIRPEARADILVLLGRDRG